MQETLSFSDRDEFQRKSIAENIVKLLEQISVPLTSSRDCDNAFVVAYDIYSDGYHHYYSEVTRYLLQNKNIKLDNIENV